MNADERRSRQSLTLHIGPRLRLPGASATRSALALWVPDAAVLVAIAALGWVAAGKFVTSGLFVYGDHPGQFMRMWYALAVSLPQNWRVVDWNPLWYAGYPELQFYPPGHVLAGVLLNFLTLGRLSPERVYNLIPVVAMVLPAFTTFVFLRSVLDGVGRWPARVAGLASAYLALTFTPMWGGTNSVPIGLMGERLAFGLVPLALLAGWRLVEMPNARRLAVAALLLAALVLMHPFHAPAVVLATCLYALARKFFAGIGRLGDEKECEEGIASSAHPGSVVFVAAWVVLGLGLAAWWLVPLAIRQSPYAASLLRTNLNQTLDWLSVDPVPILLVAALPAVALLLYPKVRVSATIAALVLLMPVLALGILFDTSVLFGRLGVTAFDPIRFIAEYYMALLLLTGAGVGVVVSPWLWRHWPVAASLALLIVVTIQPHADVFVRDLRLWSRFTDRNMATEMLQNPALAGLWDTLRNDPERDGRVLFTSYYTQLQWPGPDTTATAVKAMTPYYTGREIVGGTFSHWSPVARLMWVGDPWVRLLPDRVEAEDDRSLFGMSWDQMNGDRLVDELRALNVSTIVAGPGDPNARAWLDANPGFERFWDNGYFYLYHRRGVQPSWVQASGADVRIIERSPRRWVIQVDHASMGAALTASMTFYPLWRAEAGGQPLAIQPDGHALQRAELPPGGPYKVTLSYREGWPEWSGLVLTVAALLVMLLALVRRRVRKTTVTGASSQPSDSLPSR